MATRSPIGNELLEGVAEVTALDRVAKPIGKAVRNLTRPKALKEALSGTWLGHPAHPALIAVPIGSWVSALVLDWLGGEDAEAGADVLVGTGLAAALPTVATGYNDWADAEPASDYVRRVGTVHATLNAAAAVLFGASLAARLSGERMRGKWLALAGGGVVGAGGYLGGHLTYAKGVGVNLTAFEDYPQEWTPVLAEAALGEAEARAVELDGLPILLARWHGEVYALSNTCVHRGGSLADGELHDGCVTCPLHQSTFRLEDGSVERGPAAFPQPGLATRVHDGSIEVRAPAG